MNSKQKPFPVYLWQEIQSENTRIYLILESFQKRWKNIRSQLSLTDTERLDMAFKNEFENLERFFWGRKEQFNIATRIFGSLQELVNMGASAEKLNKDASRGFNIAEAIRYFPSFTKQQDLDLANKIIWLTIQAGASLLEQRSYTRDLSVCCLINDMSKANVHPLEQLYEYSYQITCLMFVSNIGIPMEDCDGLLFALLADNCQKDESKKIAMRLIKRITDTSFSYFSLSKILVNVVKHKQWEMIPILLPSLPHMKNLTQIIREFASKEDIRGIINAFTLSKTGRNIFKHQFQHHWLLQHTIDNYPGILFDLVKRREKTILETFCKKHRLKLINLKDTKGNTLLHIAASSNGKMKNIAKILLNAGADPTIKNNENVTPYDMVLKSRRSDLKELFGI
ncbi:hypothetical protein [Candidatus Uabimicrobium sp. HlEnr_7]|uniref:hypothetical protein n=1 Tax=Candidatus Uabimicrobium helgolandensis TaxID=3095367 RepID=UPI0035573068